MTGTGAGTGIDFLKLWLYVQTFIYPLLHLPRCKAPQGKHSLFKGLTKGKAQV